MQLTIDQKYSRYYPPKSQLLKWVGNKQRFAAEIAKYFPNEINVFFEPFLGSGAISATVAPINGIGSDVFKPLIEIWTKLIDKPDELINWYERGLNLVEDLGKGEAYKKILHSYNTNPNGCDFLFLSRTCYGGIIRFRKSDGFMSTPCGVHNPIPLESFIKRVKEWRARVKNMQFLNIDYTEAFDLSRAGDFIYCDPPYSHSQSILYGAQDFKLLELFNKIQIAKENGVKIALSIDGNKKSGNYVCDLEIPQGLFEQEIMINCGKSMLRRFQMEGETLENEQVFDRLLLTY